MSNAKATEAAAQDHLSKTGDWTGFVRGESDAAGAVFSGIHGVLGGVRDGIDRRMAENVSDANAKVAAGAGGSSALNSTLEGTARVAMTGATYLGDAAVGMVGLIPSAITYVASGDVGRDGYAEAKGLIADHDQRTPVEAKLHNKLEGAMQGKADEVKARTANGYGIEAWTGVGLDVATTVAAPGAAAKGLDLATETGRAKMLSEASPPGTLAEGGIARGPRQTPSQGPEPLGTGAAAPTRPPTGLNGTGGTTISAADHPEIVAPGNATTREPSASAKPPGTTGQLAPTREDAARTFVPGSRAGSHIAPSMASRNAMQQGADAVMADLFRNKPPAPIGHLDPNQPVGMAGRIDSDGAVPSRTREGAQQTSQGPDRDQSSAGRNREPETGWWPGSMPSPSSLYSQYISPLPQMAISGLGKFLTNYVHDPLRRLARADEPAANVRGAAEDVSAMPSDVQFGDVSEAKRTSSGGEKPEGANAVDADHSTEKAQPVRQTRVRGNPLPRAVFDTFAEKYIRPAPGSRLPSNLILDGLASSPETAGYNLSKKLTFAMIRDKFPEAKYTDSNYKQGIDGYKLSFEPTTQANSQELTITPYQRAAFKEFTRAHIERDDLGHIDLEDIWDRLKNSPEGTVISKKRAYEMTRDLYLGKVLSRRPFRQVLSGHRFKSDANTPAVTEVASSVDPAQYSRLYGGHRYDEAQRAQLSEFLRSNTGTADGNDLSFSDIWDRFKSTPEGQSIGMRKTYAMIRSERPQAASRGNGQRGWMLSNHKLIDEPDLPTSASEAGSKPLSSAPPVTRPTAEQLDNWTDHDTKLRAGVMTPIDKMFDSFRARNPEFPNTREAAQGFREAFRKQTIVGDAESGYGLKGIVLRDDPASAQPWPSTPQEASGPAISDSGTSAHGERASPAASFVPTRPILPNTERVRTWFRNDTVRRAGALTPFDELFASFRTRYPDFPDSEEAARGFRTRFDPALVVGDDRSGYSIKGIVPRDAPSP